MSEMVVSLLWNISSHSPEVWLSKSGQVAQSEPEYSLVLSDYAEFAYKCTDFYHPNDEGGLLWNDPDIGIEWPLQDGVELTLSDKDQKWDGIKKYIENRIGKS